MTRAPGGGPRPLGERIATLLTTRRLGRPIVSFRSTDSTMARARALLGEGARRGRVVVAERQTAGRGRAGRPFVSPPGGLYLTAELEPLEPPGVSWRLGLCAAVAIREAVSGLGGPELALSWPNDLFDGPRKVAGVLAELVAGPPGATAALVGLGVNVATDPRALGGVEAGPAGALPALRARDSLAELGALLLAALEGLDDRVRAPAGWADVLESVRLAMRPAIGLPVTARTPDGGRVRGRCEGIAEDGALLVRRSDGTVVPVRHGELRHA